MSDWAGEGDLSAEARDILGFVEALPRDARRELVAVVELLCRSQGYHSLHDGVIELSRVRQSRLVPDRARRRDELAEVIRHPHWSEE